MGSELKRRVKEEVSIRDLAERQGLALKDEGSCLKTLCPFHDDSATPSLALYSNSSGPDRWKCFGACQTGGDVIDFYRKLHGLGFRDALNELASIFNLSEDSNTVPPPRQIKPKPKKIKPDFETPSPATEPINVNDFKRTVYGRAVEIYEYPMQCGGKAHEIRHYPKTKDGEAKKKESRWTRLSSLGIIFGLSEKEYYRREQCWFGVNDRTPKDAERRFFAKGIVNLYRTSLPFDDAQKGTDWIFLCEGPKDAEAAHSLGLHSTTSPNGADGFKAHHAKELAGHNVAIIADHDEAGKAGITKRVTALSPTAAEVRTLPFLGGEFGSGYDLSDYIEDQRKEGRTDDSIRAALLEMLEAVKQKLDPVQVRVTPEEHLVNEKALESVSRHPNFFQRLGSLVHVVPASGNNRLIKRPKGSPIIRRIQEAHLQELLSRYCRFVKVKHVRGEEMVQPVHPPTFCSKALMARDIWPDHVRHLDSVVECPVLRPDGTVQQTEGYDEETGMLFKPSEKYAKIPDEPTQKDVEDALALLKEVVCDFPFKSEASYSAWLSGLLTPLARYTFSGPSPFNLIDANVPGAGKSLLADVICKILTGRSASRMAFSKDDDEMRKKITALALTGAQVVLIDNVTGILGGAALDAALTGEIWRDRPLRKSEDIEVYLDMTWFATANNVTLGGDLARRILWIQLESQEEHPEDRTDFRHPQLLPWVAKERYRIMPAALILLRAWWLAGKPTQPLKGMGSYEGWSDVVRQCIVYHGLADPADTRLNLKEIDTRTAALGRLIQGLDELLQERAFLPEATVSEILAKLKEKPARYEVLRVALSELISIKDDLPTPRQLGYLLRKNVNRVIEGGSIRRVEDRVSNKGVIWTVAWSEVGVALKGRSGDGGDGGDDSALLGKTASGDSGDGGDDSALVQEMLFSERESQNPAQRGKHHHHHHHHHKSEDENPPQRGKHHHYHHHHHSKGQDLELPVGDVGDSDDTGVCSTRKENTISNSNNYSIRGLTGASPPSPTSPQDENPLSVTEGPGSRGPGSPKPKKRTKVPF